MKKEDLLAIAKEAAKSIKSEHDLNALTQMLSKIIKGGGDIYERFSFVTDPFYNSV